MTAVIVGSVIANKPGNGGNAWAVMNWVLGLQAAGCDVIFCEQIDSATCTDRLGRPAAFQESVNLEYFRGVMQRFGLSDRSALICDGGLETEGLRLPELIDAAHAADALINVSGHITLERIMSAPGRRVYIDLDPGFTQYWHADGAALRLDEHDLFFTIGENIGLPGCEIPTSGIPWQPIRQPIVPDSCPPAPATPFGAFTTVGTWRGPFGPVYAGDRRYGIKVHEFRRFLDLPERTGYRFELALDMYPEDWRDREALEARGWHLVDPGIVAGDPDSFDGYIRSSGAEFSAAQGVYVHTRSGWFSDRSARYLAAGKPVLVQDTGFGRTIPTGEGLLTFSTVEEAAEGTGQIASEYAAHSAAARSLAREYFNAVTVLGPMIEQLSTAPTPREVHHVAY